MALDDAEPKFAAGATAAPAAGKPAPALAAKRKAPKRFIKTNVAVHDRTQLETVFDYYLYRGSGKKKQKVLTPTGHIVKIKRPSAEPLTPPVAPKSLSYQVEVFLFYPRDCGLDAETYPKERFFADFRPLLRFREPKVGFKAMLATKPGSLSPLGFLQDYLAKLKADVPLPETSEQAAVDEVRLFACTFVSLVLRTIERHRRRLERRRTRLSEVERLEDFCKRCGRLQRLMTRADQVLSRYRELLTAAETLGVERAGSVLPELRLIDEYCYYRLRDGMAYLASLTPPSEASPLPALASLQGEVLRLLRAHEAHAVSCGYMQVTAASPRVVKERFIHRRSELKRRIWTVLFLEIRTTPLFALQQQVGAMAAAAAAAVWAGVAQFMLVKKAMAPRQLNDVLGLSGFLFVSAVVLAYVVKDRIKEFGRSYFGSGVFRNIPDHSENIYYNNRAGKPTAVGSVEERAKFVKVDALPERIKDLRLEAATTFATATDDGITHALRYSKIIKLSPKLKILNRYPLRAVHDILRLNINSCLLRLAEPMRTLELITDDGTVEAALFPKVYYLDMILSYSRLADGTVAAERSLDFFRLVMEKNGLLRIERRH